MLDQRLHHAEYLLETTDLPIYEVARQCGLGSPDTLRHHFLRRRRTGPQSYRRTFQATVSATTPRLGSPG